MPAGWTLAVLLCTAYIIQGILAWQVLDDPDGAQSSIVAILFQVIVVTVLLSSRGRATRAPQTISAIAGVGLIFGLMSVGLLSQIREGENQSGLFLLYLGLFFWSLAVDGHIYRHALSVKMQTGIMVAVLIFAANFVLLRLLFGSPT